MEPGWQVSLIDLREYTLPAFEERIQYLEEVPPDVRLISDELKSSDGIIFISPEYNGGISSSLKYIIDIFGNDEFAGKPIGVATASSGIQGGIRAALQLQQTILAIRSYPQPEMLLVPVVSKTIDENGDILSPSFESKVKHFVISFLAFTSHLTQLRAGL
jgi:NAD(P)H-dependent FMN reductase